MEFLLILLAIYLLVMPLVAMGIANRAADQAAQLRQELRILQAELARLSAPTQRDGKPEISANALAKAKAESAVPPVPSAVRSDLPPPPPERMRALMEAKPRASIPNPPSPAPEVKPPLLSSSLPPSELPGSPTTPAFARKPEFTWEQFMGVKLFAWLGGLALFIGIVLFVKYAIEHNLISPAARTAIGAAVGLGLCLTGLHLRGSERYRVLSHTLCATGVLILYGVSYAGHGFYNLYSQMTAFTAVAAVTVAAFFIAVRMEAQVVSVLGMLGGFLAPLILYTGVDRPLGLFTYVALLDMGVLAVVHCRGWHSHTALAAGGTGITTLIWLLKFWTKSGYAHGTATLVPLAVLLFFPALFCAAGWWQKSRTARSFETLAASSGLSWMALWLSLSAVLMPTIAERPWLIFGFAFLLYALTGVAAWRELKLLTTCTAAGGFVFLLLAVWSGRALTSGLLPHALALYLIFGLLQAGLPVLWSRRSEGEPLPPSTLWMPLLVLVLMLISVLRVPESAAGIWIAVLAVNASLLALARLSRQAAPVEAAFGLTMLTLFAWLMAIVEDAALASSLRGQFLLVLAASALLLTAGGFWLRGLVPTVENEPVIAGRNMAVLVPAALPFPLLIIATCALPDVPYAPVAGIMLALAALLMFVAAKLRLWELYPITLVAVFGVELALHNKAWDVTGGVRVAWCAAAWALLLAFPFLFRRETCGHVWPWITASVAGVAQFILIRDTVAETWPGMEPGILPALCALPPALGLWLVHRDRATESGVRRSQLAWFGGVTLLFITLIVPLQWKREWITLAVH
jgi:hypothetical protein